MLIQFRSEVGGFVMFGDVAVKLLRMTGHSGTVPGAIGADEMEQALARVRSAVEAQTADEEQPPPPAAEADGDSKPEPPVSLTQRAFPLIELMTRAVDEQCAIAWDKA